MLKLLKALRGKFVSIVNGFQTLVGCGKKTHNALTQRYKIQQRNLRRMRRLCEKRRKLIERAKGKENDLCKRIERAKGKENDLRNLYCDQIQRHQETIAGLLQKQLNGKKKMTKQMTGGYPMNTNDILPLDLDAWKWLDECGICPLERKGDSVVEIDSGEFGSVFPALSGPNIQVAVKVVRHTYQGSMANETMRQEEADWAFRRETVTIRRKWAHPNILTAEMAKMLSCIYMVVMPWIPDTLYSILQKQELTFDMAMKFHHSINNGLHYCHQHLVVHNDSHNGNWLVVMNGNGKPTGVLKLCDFGQCKSFDKESSIDITVRLLQYEIIAQRRLYTQIGEAVIYSDKSIFDGIVMRLTPEMELKNNPNPDLKSVENDIMTFHDNVNMLLDKNVSG